MNSEKVKLEAGVSENMPVSEEHQATTQANIPTEDTEIKDPVTVTTTPSDVMSDKRPSTEAVTEDTLLAENTSTDAANDSLLVENLPTTSKDTLADRNPKSVGMDSKSLQELSPPMFDHVHPDDVGEAAPLQPAVPDLQTLPDGPHHNHGVADHDHGSHDHIAENNDVVTNKVENVELPPLVLADPSPEQQEHPESRYIFLPEESEHAKMLEPGHDETDHGHDMTSLAGDAKSETVMAEDHGSGHHHHEYDHHGLNVHGRDVHGNDHLGLRKHDTRHYSHDDGHSLHAGSGHGIIGPHGHDYYGNHHSYGDAPSSKMYNLMHSDTILVILSLLLMILLGLVFRSMCMKLTSKKDRKKKMRSGMRQIAEHMNHVTRAMSNDLELPDSPKTVMRTYSNYNRRPLRGEDSINNFDDDDNNNVPAKDAGSARDNLRLAVLKSAQSRDRITLDHQPLRKVQSAAPFKIESPKPMRRVNSEQGAHQRRRDMEDLVKQSPLAEGSTGGDVRILERAEVYEMKPVDESDAAR